MARIRSIHPDLFTDEAFMGLSPSARLFMIGLWTESDDHGAFEWQPTRLRFKLAPVDKVKGEDLLAELEQANIIRKVEIGGRSYGLVRNFCRFQRPKKPTYKVEIPPEHRNFIALKDDGTVPSHYHITGITQPVGNNGENVGGDITHQSPTSTEKPAQEKEEGGRRKGKEESKSIDKPVVVVAASDPETASGTTTTTKVENDLAVQETQPKQIGSALGTVLPETWVPDETCIAVAHDHGMTDSDIDGEVLRFHALNAQRGTFSQNWSKTWTLWCAEFKRRATKESAKAPARVEVSAAYKPSIDEWEKAVERWKANNSHWSRHYGPEPGMSGCRCPAPLLIAHGIDPATGRALPAQVSA
ncbi:hypothetical protein ABIB86_000464 [Bradyrhizobium sp. JR1.7]|uniref:hypothetical protein n=1 Tax=unclassified Bradyrhizobium TaxID=2631580 RepID=UPI00339B98FB